MIEPSSDTLIIPAEAEERIEETFASGTPKLASYWIADIQIGRRFWDMDGMLGLEYRMHGEHMHGLFRRWDAGILTHETAYRDGKEHGTARQYDQHGTMIGSYTMIDGTGLDLWFYAAGVLAEERACHDGALHGFERWWNDDNATIYQESHFWHGQEHGVFRRWNAHGRLARGYPQYFIKGRKVTKRQYLQASATDDTLPRFQIADHNPHRTLPMCRQPDTEKDQTSIRG